MATKQRSREHEILLARKAELEEQEEAIRAELDRPKMLAQELNQIHLELDTIDQQLQPTVYTFRTYGANVFLHKDGTVETQPMSEPYPECCQRYGQGCKMFMGSVPVYRTGGPQDLSEEDALRLKAAGQMVDAHKPPLAYPRAERRF